jgi:hypothetical protein
MCGRGTDQLGGDGRRQHGPGGAARAAGDLPEHGLHEPDQEVQAAVFFQLPVLRIVVVFLAAAPVTDRQPRDGRPGLRRRRRGDGAGQRGGDGTEGRSAGGDGRRKWRGGGGTVRRVRQGEGRGGRWSSPSIERTSSSLVGELFKI